MSDKNRPHAGCCAGACKCRPVETTNVIAFEVPGLPVPKARARVTRAGITYTPQETLNYEAQVRVAYANAYPGRQPFAAGTALVLQLEAFFPLPAGAPKRVRRQMEAGTTMPMTQRPDLDNLVKTVLDALNRVAWADDGQVAEITARKRRTVGAPRLSVCIAELVSPVTSLHACGSAQNGQGGAPSRSLASAPYPRVCERPKAVVAPAGDAGATDAVRPGVALGPSCARSVKDPTGNTWAVR